MGYPPLKNGHQHISICRNSVFLANSFLFQIFLLLLHLIHHCLPNVIAISLYFASHFLFYNQLLNPNCVLPKILMPPRHCLLICHLLYKLFSCLFFKMGLDNIVSFELLMKLIIIE